MRMWTPAVHWREGVVHVASTVSPAEAALSENDEQLQSPLPYPLLSALKAAPRIDVVMVSGVLTGYNMDDQRGLYKPAHNFFKFNLPCKPDQSVHYPVGFSPRLFPTRWLFFSFLTLLVLCNTFSPMSTPPPTDTVLTDAPYYDDEQHQQHVLSTPAPNTPAASFPTRTVAIIKTHALAHRFDIEPRIQEARFEVRVFDLLPSFMIRHMGHERSFPLFWHVDRQGTPDGVRHRNRSGHVI